MRGLKGGEACYLRCCKMGIKSDKGELWLGGMREEGFLRSAKNEENWREVYENKERVFYV